MGYALFAQEKLLLTGLINSIQMQQMQRSDEQMRLSTNTLGLQAYITTLQSKQSDDLTEQYDKLMDCVSETKYKQMNESSLTGKAFEDEFHMTEEEFHALDVDSRQKIQDNINKIQSTYDSRIQNVQRQIQAISIKENGLEMEVKRLDTKLTAYQQRLEKIEEAEGKGIEKATPKFTGIG